MRSALALVVLLATAPAWAVKLDAVAPQCAAIGAEITVSGKGLRKMSFAVGGVGTLTTKRSRTQATILVPSGVPSGATTIEAERGKKRVTVPFVVKGDELCDGVDNDCNGFVDDIVQDDRSRCENGHLLLGRRDATTALDACVPGTIEACYSGPEDTEGVGLCHAGARVCSLDGIWGRCDGEVVPGEEDPGNGIDEDCNGRDGPGGGELCIPGTLRTCYSGPPATRDVGLCHAGALMCDDAGFFGACENEVVPVPDVPGNDVDENCDGGDGQRAPLLDIVVNPVLSPTFQTSQVLTGTVGTELAPVTDPPPPPLVASVSPNNGRQGQTLTVTVTGQNSAFAEGTTQVNFGSGVSVTSLVVAGPSTLTVGLSIAPNASIGPRVVAVATNRQEAIASNAFNVHPADAAVGGKVADATGTPIAGATVCVGGTSICTTTGADGTFTLPGVPTNATRLIVTKAGFAEFSIAIGDRSSDVNVGLLAFEDTGEPQPPPPQSGAPPLDAKIASVVARLNTTAPELLTPDQARKTVRDFILLVGGDELGLLDAQGAQQNPEITGTGPLSIKPEGIDVMARGFQQGAAITFEQWIFSLALTFQWSGSPPDVDVMLSRFQTAVDAAWADPDAPTSALMISLFNPGPVFVKDPPRLSRVTRLSRVGTTVLLAAVMIDAMERRTGQGPAGNIAVALRDDVLSDVPIILAQADPPPGEIRSFRQLTRALPDMDDVALAISQAIVGSAVFAIPAAIAGGTIGIVTLVGAGVGGVAELFLFAAAQATLTARIAPLPPAIVGVESSGRVVRIKVQRTDKDTPQYAQRAGPQLGRFNYTVYRGCLTGGTRVVVANVSVPFGKDDPAGVFEVVDRRPVPGLNCYYADVVQNVGIDIPPALQGLATALSVPARVPFGDVLSLLFVSDLLSDYSVPSPFPMPGQPGADGEDDPTDAQVAMTRVVWTPPASQAGEGPYAFVDAVRADDAGNYYVSDSESGTVTKTLPSRQRQPYAVTGFNGPQVGLAIDAQASVYTESVDSESRFSGRTFKFAQPDGAKKFTGTVDKYSPLLDRGNEVAVSSLAIGPGIAGGLGDLFAAENYHRRIRRLPTSIIPPAGIEALPAPGHGIFGPLAASPIVGFPYVDFPTCEQGRIADIDFDQQGTLYAVTDSNLYAVPYDVDAQAAGERRTIAQLGCGDGAVQVEVTGPKTMATASTRTFTATGSPCAGSFHWSTDDETVLEVGDQHDGGDGAGSVSVKGLKQGRTKLIAEYETAQGTARGEIDVFVGGPFIFFHGIGGTAKNWDDLRDYLLQTDQLGSTAFGGELCDSTVAPYPTIPGGRPPCADAPIPPPAFMYTYNFRDSVGSFIDQGDEVARVIERVKAANHVDKVTIVGFSMGGVSVRSYVEDLAPTKRYANDVAEVFTINTPHKGSPWPNLTQVPIVTFFIDTAQDVVDADAAFYGGAIRGIREAIPPPRANSDGLIQLQFFSPALNTLNSPAHRPPADIKFTNVIAKSDSTVALNLCFFLANALDLYAGDYSTVVPSLAPFNLCTFFENSDLIVGTDSQDLNSIFPGIATEYRVTGHHNGIPPIPPNDVPFMLHILGLTP
ncbi:MAG TPA: carboxypeptidase regulatory-like domain-containing protein [Candidatus Binatia bacterium]|jgi:pimeloyl-ACP methyl ester carboxylesterase|nr:carboxypeptidase regulatory-like domain-containing protein [Candidatus Binatia bacterium]